MFLFILVHFYIDAFLRLFCFLCRPLDQMHKAMAACFKICISARQGGTTMFILIGHESQIVSGSRTLVNPSSSGGGWIAGVVQFRVHFTSSSSVCGSMGVTVLQKEIIIITTRNATLCKGDPPRSCVESCCDKGGMPCGVKCGQGENRPPSIRNADHVQQIGRIVGRNYLSYYGWSL